MLRTTTSATVLLAALTVLALAVRAEIDTEAEIRDADGNFIERFEDGDAARGEDMYLQFCRGCHGEDGRGGAHTFMPHIENLTKKEHIEVLPDSHLFVVIAEGGPAVGLSRYMPAWKSKLSADDIKDIIAHIRSLPTY